MNNDQCVSSKSADSSTNSQSSLKIRERSFAFSLRVIKLFQHLEKQKNGVGSVLGKQFLRAACSVGANVEEAQSAESRADFIHKLGIAQKESRESLYWLRLLGESRVMAKPKLGPLMEEAEALIRILGSIILYPEHKKWPPSLPKRCS